tara:strand:+ start:1233 stop:1427 length:195 start_codon:yes stop_codon:yes gene_type:complete
MGKVYKFTGKKVPEQQRDYAPIRREKIVLEIREQRRASFWNTAILSALVFSVYGFLLLSIYQGL